MKYKKVSDNEWFVRLDPGDEIHRSLRQFAVSEDIQGAEISGIGGLEEVEIGVFVLENKAYESETMRQADTIEVISLNGNLTYKDDQPFTHLHALVTAKGKPFLGGHLVRGVVKVTMEIWVRQVEVKLERREVPELGFFEVGI